MSGKRPAFFIAYSLVFLALCAFSLRGKGFALAFAVIGVQALVFAIMPSRSIISYSFSHLPALSMLLLLSTGNQLWLWLVIALSASLASMRLLRRLPQPRPTTDAWVGSLLLAEVLAVTVSIL